MAVEKFASQANQNLPNAPANKPSRRTDFFRKALMVTAFIFSFSVAVPSFVNVAFPKDEPKLLVKNTNSGNQNKMKAEIVLAQNIETYAQVQPRNRRYKKEQSFLDKILDFIKREPISAACDGAIFLGLSALGLKILSIVYRVAKDEGRSGSMAVAKVVVGVPIFIAAGLIISSLFYAGIAAFIMTFPFSLIPVGIYYGIKKIFGFRDKTPYKSKLSNDQVASYYNSYQLDDAQAGGKLLQQLSVGRCTSQKHTK